MALYNRPIEPKNPKIRNKALIANYGHQNPCCEACALHGRHTERDAVHHLIPGNHRTDRHWNIIALCFDHHLEATEHVNGSKAKRFNHFLFAIKYMKHEICDKKLRELSIFDEVMDSMGKLIPLWKRYTEGNPDGM